MSLTYGVICIVSLIMVGVCLIADRKKEIWLLLLFISVGVCNTGYFLLSISQSLETALAANRIAYLGNVFLPFFMLMLLMRICGIRHPRWLPALLIAAGTAVLAAAASQGYLTLYYSWVSLEITESGSHLLREYGPLHGIYYVYLFAYFAAMLAVVGYATARKKLKSYLYGVVLLSAVLVNILVWLAEQFLPRGFEFLSVAHVLSEALLLVMYGAFQQYNMRRRIICTWMVGFLCVGLAMLCSYALIVHPSNCFPGILRGCIYIGMYYAWGRIVCRGIIQKTQRRCLGAVAALLILWTILNVCGSCIFPGQAALNRYLWYACCVPQILAAVLGLMTALMEGKGEDESPGKWSGALFGGAAALILLVMTNDLHQLVFSVPGDGSGLLGGCAPEAGYPVLIVLTAACGAGTLALFVKKCRIPQRRRLAVFPMLGLAGMGFYDALYFAMDGFSGTLVSDKAAVDCLLIAALFEFLMESGLFQANMGYESLFQQSMLAAQITDRDHHTYYRSEGARVFSPEILAEADRAPVLLDQTTRLSGAAISGGHIYWQEDVAELLSVQEKLEMAQEELRDTGDVLKAESEQTSYRIRLELENRLYDMVERQTARQVAALRDLTARLQQLDDLEAAKDLLGRIVIIGTYVKRRSNLIFVEGQEGSIRTEELLLCVNESAESLKLYGISCRAEIQGRGRLDPAAAYAAYDLFEAVIEAGMDTASSILFRGEAGDGGFSLTVCADCVERLDGLCRSFPQAGAEQDEDGLWYLTASFACQCGEEAAL